MSQIKVGLVGAGYIADIHAEALASLPNLSIAAVADPVIGRAEQLARRWGCKSWFDNCADMIGQIDAAHVLVPPHLHRPVAEPLLKAGLHVFLEKPMATSPEDCAVLSLRARESGAALGVNQNFPFHPAHQRMNAMIKANRIGPVRHISLTYNMPLRQLDAGQLGHWMFLEPVNLLLEQAVHPLSQIDDLLGQAVRVDAQPQPARVVAPGIELITSWLVSLQCEHGTAQLQFALGQKHPVWQMSVIGDDGRIEADMLNNRVVASTPGRWLDAADALSNGLNQAQQLCRESMAGAVGYVGSVSGLSKRNDPFFLSMRGSIESFYKKVGNGERALGDMGTRAVQVCSDIARRVNGPKARPRPVPPANDARFDVVLLGGTGFIGRYVLQRLRQNGARVAVFARSVDNLPAPYHDPAVGLFRGSISNLDAVRDVVSRAPLVINLAHGGGGGTAAEIEQAMVGGARLVADAVLEAGCRHLIFISSIAALDLGKHGVRVSMETPPDPNAEGRAAYARAKAIAEHAMLSMHTENGLPVTIMRPGVVLGAGTSPFHSGIGLFNRETHCLGWNGGRNPLPLVLASDVADAIVASLDKPETLGKSFNLIGDVRLTAREYMRALGKASGRPLQFHPQSTLVLQAEEIGKWIVKRIAGRKVPFPSYADLKSRGMPAEFDCSNEKTMLGWYPENDRERFLQQSFATHG